MSALLEVAGAVTGYGRTRVLHGLSLTLNEGRSLGVCGPNGHGKTTLMRAVSGLLRLWEGDVRFDGKSIARSAPQSIVEAGLIHVPQGNRLFPELSVAENLRLGAYSQRARPNEAENLERVFALFPKLKTRRSQKCRTLSGGERQMLSIGVGVMAQPRLLILDEPNLGLAPIVKEELGEAIQDIAERDITLILIEQDIEFIMSVTNHILVVEQGEITVDTSIAGDMTHEEIVSRYFGENA